MEMLVNQLPIVVAPSSTRSGLVLCLENRSLQPLLGSVLPLQHSYREVGILLLYLAVGVSVFSGIAYTAEYEEVGVATIFWVPREMQSHM